MIGRLDTNALFTSGIWTFVALLAVALVRAWPALKKLGIEGDGAMRGDLLTRIKDLEAKESGFAARIEEVRASYEAEVRIMRHRLNNITMCFDALLLLIEQAPERAAESVAKVKELRRQQEVAEAQEKAIISGARIQAAAAAKGAAE